MQHVTCLFYSKWLFAILSHNLHRSSSWQCRPGPSLGVEPLRIQNQSQTCSFEFSHISELGRSENVEHHLFAVTCTNSAATSTKLFWSGRLVVPPCCFLLLLTVSSWSKIQSVWSYDIPSIGNFGMGLVQTLTNLGGPQEHLLEGLLHLVETSSILPTQCFLGPQVEPPQRRWAELIQGWFHVVISQDKVLHGIISSLACRKKVSFVAILHFMFLADKTLGFSLTIL